MANMIKISDLEFNEGQIQGLDPNPRQWTSEDIEQLAKSIEETPELLEARPLIAIPFNGKYIVLGGNLRLEALKYLKRKKAPVYLLREDTPVEKLREIVIKDNSSFGAWDMDMLQRDWADLNLKEWGLPEWVLPREGTEGAINALFEPSHAAEKNKDEKLTIVIPKKHQEAKEAIKEALSLTLEEWPGCSIQ